MSGPYGPLLGTTGTEPRKPHSGMHRYGFIETDVRRRPTHPVFYSGLLPPRLSTR